jgi:ATP-dependent RNA helicase SUPV3L1/SUV3
MEQYSQLIRGLLRWDDEARRSCHAWGINDPHHLKLKGDRFKEMIANCVKLANERDITDKERNPLFYKLRHAFIHSDVSGLSAEMKYAFIHLVVGEQFSAQDDANQKRLADLRYPIEWYPATRMMQRKIHLHVGPTNSGKTYNALQRLEAAESGIYAGPLRLLAHEVYTRMNAKGKPCALVTGEERRYPEGLNATMSSCTVEMVPLNTRVDVAVIDEIQMMGDVDRGWAWTQALFGVMAKEVHLCGELRTIPLIKELCAAMGDKLEIHTYKRLSPLKAMPNSLNGDLRKLRKGDAIILFSRVQIHAMKRDIEQATGRRCAVVYGSLPPETRAQQANLFNDPDNDYDFLVASDAIGMGLNLSIKRVIFEATSKHDGSAFKQMQISDIKQIAGRAGRYRTARDAVEKGPNDLTDGEPTDTQAPLQLRTSRPRESIGYVTTLEKFDLPIVRSAMETEVEPLKTAGIFPPASVLTRFASYFPSTTPFSYILLRLHEISSVSSRFHLCRLREQVDIADLIQPFRLSISDKMIFMAAPVNLRDPGLPDVLIELAKCVADQSSGHILELTTLKLELLDINPTEYFKGSAQYLKETEALHKAITLYLWLSYRFTGVFHSQQLAFHIKELAEKKIDECLAHVNWDQASRERMRRQRLKVLRQQTKRLNLAGQESSSDVSEILGASRVMMTDTSEGLEDAHEVEDLPTSNAGVPVAPDGEIPMKVVNAGPLWEKLQQHEAATP